MNIGIIGLGKMGQIHQRVLGALRLEGAVDNIYVYDVRDVPGKTSLRALLDKSDGVVVATPTHSHKRCVDMCLQLGKPVFCEKPFSESYTKIDNCYAKWATRKNPSERPLLFVGYIERYNAIVDRFKCTLAEVLRDKDDCILYMSMRRISNTDYSKFVDRDIITDLGVHDFDVLHSIFESVVLDSARIIGAQDKAIFAQCLFKLDEGVFCDLIISWLDIYKRREYVVYTRKKIITVDLCLQKMTVLDRRSEKQDTCVISLEPAYVEMKAFIEFIESGIPVPFPDPIGLQSQRLAEEILNSAEVVEHA